MQQVGKIAVTPSWLGETLVVVEAAVVAVESGPAAPHDDDAAFAGAGPQGGSSA